MPKVYPNAVSTAASAGDVLVLTVWKKSLLLNCNGFTVFDSKGNLVFRVDNYLSGNKGEIVLMDASGKSLFTIRRKKLSLADNWMVFDEETAVNPRFSVRKQYVNFLNTKSLALVTSGGGGGSGTGPSSPKKSVIYGIEGSYTQRCCAVYDDKRRRVAEIKRKEAVRGVTFGGDVFHLVVHPEIDADVAMSLVILLDQMFGSAFSTPMTQILSMGLILLR